MKKLLLLSFLFFSVSYAQIGINAGKTVTFDSSTVPTTPSAKRAKLFSKGVNGWFGITSDGHVKRIDSAGGTSNFKGWKRSGEGLDSVQIIFKDSTTITTMSRGDTLVFYIKGDTTINTGSFCDGSDGEVTVTKNTTTSLSRDMCYDTLYLDSASRLNTNGYKVFANVIKNTSVFPAYVSNSGGAGGNGADGQTSGTATGGTAGAAAGSGSTVAMGAGTVGNTGAPAQSGGTCTDPTATAGAIANAIGTVGDTGARGGVGGLDSFGNSCAPSCTFFLGDAAGTFTALASTYGNARTFNPMTTNRITNTSGTTVAFTMNGTNGSAGGGGEGHNANGTPSNVGGGAGAGGGGNGGFLIVQVKTLIGLVDFQTLGGAGGNGGKGCNGIEGGGSTHGGGGGGGAAGEGGNGGICVVVTHDNSLWTGTLSAAHGANGTPGAGGSKSAAGATDGGTGGTPPTPHNGLTFLYKI